MKKLSTYLFLILFSFSAPSFADDIRDFEIEGMSIGDSLLDYFSEKEIIKYDIDSNEDLKFHRVLLLSSSSSPPQNYDGMHIYIKPNDKEYIIESLDGMIGYKNDIQSCYEKMDEIVEEISSIFKSAEKAKKKTTSHDYDKSGKSKVSYVSFILESGEIDVACLDWSDEMKFEDRLTVGLETKEFRNFMENEAYK